MSAAIEKLDLKVGERHLIALTQLQGRPCQSKWAGDQLMFTLCDGRKMFVEPYVQPRIDAAAIAPGEEFEISKAEILSGNRRVVSIEVRKIGAAAVQRTTAPKQVDSNGLTTPHNSTPAPRPPQPPPLPPPPRAPVNGQGATDGDLYLECFREAVRITPELVAIAKAQGFLISPGFEDIRCIATHLSMSRRDR